MMTNTAVATVPTELPRRYMTQLCKHFEHRLTVAYDDRQGCIDFADGRCVLSAQPQALVMIVKAESPAALERIQDVVARHLLRFAFRHPPEIVWHADSPAIDTPPAPAHP
jgi:hypothetical protein